MIWRPESNTAPQPILLASVITVNDLAEVKEGIVSPNKMATQQRKKMSATGAMKGVLEPLAKLLKPNVPCQMKRAEWFNQPRIWRQPD